MTLQGEKLESVAASRRAFAEGGIKGYWRFTLEQAESDAKRRPIAMTVRAEAALRAGELEKGLKYFREAMARREVRPGNFAVMPCYSEARRDPRFHALLREAKLIASDSP